jgi:hypothetical protein
MRTDHWTRILGFAAFVLVAIAYLRVRRRIAMRPFLRREDQTQRWLADFGAENASAVGKFMDVFCDEFEFPKRYRSRISPDDHVSAYYWSYYAKGEADCLEHGSFFCRLEDEFRIRLPADLPVQELTLGRLFRIVLDNVGTPTSPGATASLLCPPSCRTTAP